MSANPQMRLATGDDVDYIVSCFHLPHVGVFLRAPAPDRVRAKLASADALHLILQADGNAAGLMVLQNIARNWSIVNIDHLIAAQPGRGYGRFMVEFAKHFAFSERKAHRLCLEVVASNSVARKLYEAQGFMHEGTFRDGFPADDGTYADLAAYGMLESEYRP